MIEKMLEELLKEISVSEEKFMAQVEKGLKIEHHRRIFEQLLIVDNFIVFKKLMVKRNKELELEAMKALEQQEMEKISGGAGGQNQATNMERMKLEAEKAQIEHAIAMSLAVEEEKKRLKEQEDLELQQVLKESEMEYQKQQEKLKQTQGGEKTADKKEEKKPEKIEKKAENNDAQKEEKKSENLEKKPEKKKESPEKKEETPENKSTPQKTEEKIVEKPTENSLTDSNFQKLQNDKTTDITKESVIVAGGSKLAAEKKVTKDKKKTPEPVEEQKDFVTLKEGSKKVEDDDEDELPLFHSKVKKEPLPGIKGHTSELPPLKSDLKYDPLSLNDLLKEKQSLAAKLDALKLKPNEGNKSSIDQKNEGEGFLERKKRLEKQRELILKKKKEEREKELKEYKEVFTK